MVSHRKQGPVLPTLIVTITPDPATEKLRKRRSSRAATLVSNKDSGPTTIWFRTDGDVSKLYDWARSIQAACLPGFPQNLPMSPMSPMSPMTPVTPSFHNPFVPFAPRDSDFSFPTRPPSAPSAPRVTLQHRASSSLHTHPERPLTISDAPSLRSKRSDLSSLPGSVANIKTHSYGSIMPTDLPTPSEADGNLFGWTSAQGRSSGLQSPTRTIRDSLGSDPPLSPSAVLESFSSPPGPRETILDRAFQLKCIPGSDQTIPGEEKLSSLARFEALMQQVDSKREKRRRSSMRPMSVKDQLELKSAWELESDEEDDVSDSDDSDDTEGESAVDRYTEADNSSIRPESRRATTFPGQHQQQHKSPKTPSQSPRGTAGIRSPMALNHEALAALVSASSEASPERPRLAHKITHNAMGSLSLGVRPLPLETSPGKSSTGSIMSSETASMYEETSGLNPSAAYRTSTIFEGQQRHSTTSSNGGKRLSFSEFTRRLSNTGSMLLAQSGAGTPTSGDAPAAADNSPSRRSSVMQPRASPAAMGLASPRGGEGDRGENCKSWRSSMLGNEGGFL